MDKYLVVGNPIAHSLSPEIHTAFAQQTHQLLTYDRLCVEPNDFLFTLDTFFASGGKGANITAPFKSMAYEYTKKHCSERAKLSKAVNTLYLNPQNNIVYGDNTDGIGLVTDLKKHDWNIKGKKILILGAGGAIRGILPALLSESPTSITLYNRTSSKTNEIIKEFQFLGPLFSFSNEKSMFDLIINSIPSRHVLDAEYWTWLSNIVSPETHAYDLNYSAQRNSDTPFISQMKLHHCQHILDGLGMLIEQAAESFYIWRSVKPDTNLFRKNYQKLRNWISLY